MVKVLQIGMTNRVMLINRIEDNNLDRQLSIIVPVYNVEKFLPECIESLERQRFDDTVEILFIDDGSPDKCPEILDKAADKNRNMRVIHQSNTGVASARNRGVEEAKGNYIAWVDPDDYITDDWWDTIRPLLNEKPEMIYFDMIAKRGCKEQSKYYAKHSYPLNHDELCKELAKGNRLESHLWSKILLRTYYLRILALRGYIFDPKLSLFEDFAALHLICWPISRCLYIHKPIYVYRQRESSIVATIQQDWLSNLLFVVKKYQERYDFYLQHNIKVKNTGILLAKSDFVWVYSVYAMPEEKIKYLWNYKEYRHDVTKHGWKLLIDSTISLGRRVSLLSILLGVEKIYFNFKKNLKQMIKRE